ncbi:hypothetical protein [Actinosynnema mirum]|uniref:Uncharacterized protein n=1 Tax=Actinosynnema mirum (strain ATCC 29888 / DSM 43827 / JCM 3225 / NBRC 14064 / NCIMB 13271 / NRRL B-12336 / IMRU 3971 / 101) TaxID=446462 RepID=C6WF17_ACTMD|nr:hypothetical protein [Actinosynnema mirum]ACU34149.1 hypothetical protein Amir_0178 [Actinosynnema mirum DSM 43827]
MTSAYPPQLDRLAMKVDKLADDHGRLPSRNEVMRTFKVGGPKAKAALDAVKAMRSAGFVAGTSLVTSPTRRLHSVPTPDEGTAEDTTEFGTEHDAAPAAEHAEPASAPADITTSTTVDAVVPTPATRAEPAPSTQVSTLADLGTPHVPTGGAVEQGRVRGAWAVLTNRTAEPRQARQVRPWPVLVIALGAFVAIWGGWVELGKLTGFGEITPLPGIADGWTIDSAITLPLGVEAYAAFALRVWLSDTTRSGRARRFAKWSALGALVLGAAGQVAYHLMSAAGLTSAPWQITTAVSCLPVIVLGLGAALAHLMHNGDQEVTR